MRAILQAPVDLLWNGGIGTYVKASDRDPRRGRRQGQRRDPGRRPRAARAVRGRGRQPRPHPARPGRVRRCATAGGAINTDFIDNSAGVDTSDHEVNIKILLDRVVARRRPDREAAQRAARRDDRRGRRAGAARQLRAEPRAGQRRRARAVAAARARGLDAPPRAGRACSTASSRACRPGARYAAGSSAARASPRPSWRCCWPGPRSCWPRSCSTATCPTTPTCDVDLMAYFPTPMRERFEAADRERTRCAARSS